MERCEKELRLWALKYALASQQKNRGNDDFIYFEVLSRAIPIFKYLQIHESFY